MVATLYVPIAKTLDSCLFTLRAILIALHEIRDRLDGNSPDMEDMPA